MIIEIDTPKDVVPEILINKIKSGLTKLHHQFIDISRVTVHFREETYHPLLKNYICEIDVTIFGNSFAIIRKSDSFETSANEVMKEVSQKVNELVQKQNEPPDEQLSTVKV
jgi:ribosome-associated translation inhibitor RaiA